MSPSPNCLSGYKCVQSFFCSLIVLPTRMPPSMTAPQTSITGIVAEAGSPLPLSPAPSFQVQPTVIFYLEDASQLSLLSCVCHSVCCHGTLFPFSPGPPRHQTPTQCVCICRRCSRWCLGFLSPPESRSVVTQHPLLGQDRGLPVTWRAQGYLPQLAEPEPALIMSHQCTQ